MSDIENKYQYNYSEIHHEEMYNRRLRERKAETMVSVLQDFFKTDLRPFTLLDVGSSTGLIANYLAMYFGKVIGIDIDGPAVEFARSAHERDNLEFMQGNSLKMEMPENYFDAVICAHVYEHVPNPAMMMDEIYRILKPGGVCYFAAGNRLNVMEPHYHLPFLSILPRSLAHIYVRAARRSTFYYEKHLSYWGLKRLVCKFERIDYTKKIIEQPNRFKADYMLKPHARKTKVAQIIVNYAYSLCPTYIWLLQKP
jgi:2-polyprenyl-3-methyl-5-hydroxy-6-metoxy-1,4-benzoquinol methylase